MHWFWESLAWLWPTIFWAMMMALSPGLCVRISHPSSIVQFSDRCPTMARKVGCSRGPAWTRCQLQLSPEYHSCPGESHNQSVGRIIFQKTGDGSFVAKHSCPLLHCFVVASSLYILAVDYKWVLRGWHILFSSIPRPRTALVASHFILILFLYFCLCWVCVAVCRLPLGAVRAGCSSLYWAGFAS